MFGEQMVLRTIYIDPHVDDLLRTQADALQTSKAELFRLYLSAGIRAVESRQSTVDTASAPADRILVLRTVYIDALVDDKLRVEAYDSRTSKNDLYRKYVELGMRVRDQQAAPRRRN